MGSGVIHGESKVYCNLTTTELNKFATSGKRKDLKYGKDNSPGAPDGAHVDDTAVHTERSTK